jgi:uncharacterized Zn-finger protein
MINGDSDEDIPNDMSSPVCYAQETKESPKMTTKDPEIFLVPQDTHQVSCNGGGGALGHPKVYYTFDGLDSVTCGYCDRVFTKVATGGAKAYKGAA